MTPEENKLLREQLARKTELLAQQVELNALRKKQIEELERLLSKATQNTETSQPRGQPHE